MELRDRLVEYLHPLWEKSNKEKIKISTSKLHPYMNTTDIYFLFGSNMFISYDNSTLYTLVDDSYEYPVAEELLIKNRVAYLTDTSEHVRNIAAIVCQHVREKSKEKSKE